MNKPLLINGFWRSGTTYLYRFLRWVSNGKALFEPLTSMSVNREDFYENDFTRQLILNRFFYTTPFFYNEFLLRSFLNRIKEYSIKEVTLHFYLNEKFVAENWNVYLIIRHPGDVFISYVKTFFRRTYLFSRVFPFLKYFYERGIIKIAKTFAHLFGINKQYFSFEEAFVIVWTITNYYALNAINPEKQLIIYEKPETYYKLPRWEEWIKMEPLRIKKYRARKKYEKKFYEFAKKFGLEKEYKEILDYIK